MTTRAHLADGTTFDYDEEAEAHPTHVNDQAVVRRQYTGKTPPRAQPGESREQQRDRLRAELKALEDDDEPAAAGAGGLFPSVS
jgi:hypothetical protein